MAVQDLGGRDGDGDHAGTVAEKFAFTVREPAIAAKLNASVGKRVALHYEQHKWIPSSCFGDTEYFLTDVRVTE